MSETTRCPSELELTRHLARELGWWARRRLQRHAAGCARCAEELSTMAAERAAFAADPRSGRELAILRALGTSETSGGWRARPWIAGLAAGAAAVVVAIVGLRRPPPSIDLTPKGADQLMVYVETPAGSRMLGARCAAGDRLIARYRTDRTDHGYLLLLEKDGSGSVQVLFPEGGTASARLDGAEGTIPQSWVLDPVKGRECFAAFFSEAPVELARARAALTGGDEPPVLAGASVRVQCCDKDAPP